MKKEIYHHAWDMLSGVQIIKLFNDTFGNSLQPAPDGTKVSIAPNKDIVNDLRDIGSATLQLLENREYSTVYRIKQTNFVFYLTQPDGDCYEFDNYDKYLESVVHEHDKLLTQFDADQPKFTANVDEHGQLWIYHHEHPNFKARYVKGELSNFDSFEPDDVFNKLDVAEAAKLMRKAGAFLMSYFKTQTK